MIARWALAAASLICASCVVFTDTSPIVPADVSDATDPDGASDVVDATDANDDAGAGFGEDPCIGQTSWCDETGAARVYCDVGPALEFCPFGCLEGVCLDTCEVRFGCASDGSRTLECTAGVPSESGTCRDGTSCVDGGCRPAGQCEPNAVACAEFERSVLLCGPHGALSVTLPCGDQRCRQVWPDRDMDGWGDQNGEPTLACGVPAGAADNALDCDDTVATDASTPCPGWVIAQPGTFTMGTDPADVEELSDDERVRQMVRFDSALLVRATEVTQAEWAEIMENPRPSFDDCDACPVNRVSWFDALAYANALSESQQLTACYTLSECLEVPGAGCGSEPTCTDGFWCDEVGFVEDCDGYRLPTEAEWEYVTRAGTTGPYSGELDDIAWYRGTAEDDFTVRPGGQRAPNPWGIYDVHGNAFEWVEDTLSEYEGDLETTLLNPVRGRDAISVSLSVARVQRGGAVNTTANTCRSSYRAGSPPRQRAFNTGFRLVRSLPTW